MSPVTMTKVSDFKEEDKVDKIKPLFRTISVLLKLSGCLIENDGKGAKHTWRDKIMVLNCVVVFLSMTLYSICLVLELFTLETLSSPWIKMFAFAILYVANTILLMGTMYHLRGNRFRKWVDRFSIYVKRYGLHKSFETIQKYARVCLPFMACLSLSSSVTVYIILIMFPAIADVFLLTILPDVVMMCIVPVPLIIIGQGMVAYLSLITCGSLLIAFQFEKIAQDINYITKPFHQDVDQQDQTDCKEMTEYRLDETKMSNLYKQYDHLCSLLSEFGACISHILLLDFFVSLPLACIMFYFRLTRINSSGDDAVIGMVMTGSLFHPVVLCSLGARINDKAHEPLEYLWRIPRSKISETCAREVHAFITRLIGPPIGYSVSGFFTITAPSSLTIASTLLTYFVVVVQFQPGTLTWKAEIGNQLANLTTMIQSLYNKSNIIEIN